MSTEARLAAIEKKLGIRPPRECACGRPLMEGRQSTCWTCFQNSRARALQACGFCEFTRGLHYDHTSQPHGTRGPGCTQFVPDEGEGKGWGINPGW